MKIRTFIIGLILTFVWGLPGLAVAQKPVVKKPGTAQAAVVKNDKEELDAAIASPPSERIEKLKAFVEAHPRSTLKMRALELIVSAHAALGEEKLKAGDAAGGTEEFRRAVAAIPSEMSAKLFTDVVVQIPSNLFARGQHAASIEVAHAIEDRVKNDPMRLLTITAFYLGIEAADEAMRVANLVLKLAPENSAAYQARGAAHRMALRLEESASDYARALELAPKSDNTRKSLAELRRATGKTEEALALFREILKVDPADEFARTGLIVSLFELGKTDEAESELTAALKEKPYNLALLTGVAYWFAAHNKGARAIEFAQKAVQIEPRFTWAHVAMARGLFQEKRAVEAERSLLFARQYGKFPTLDYEMATMLAATGFYGEAASTLSSSFAIKNDLIETYLAGRTLAQANTFTELIAPERRASIFQFTAADNETSAKSLKALLAFSSLLRSKEGPKESDVLAAAREFVGERDDMRVFRQLYVAARLLENNIGLASVLEMMDAVTGDVEPALDAPYASVAVMAEELRDARAQASLYGRTVNVPAIARNTLANVLRGRIEDVAGWTLFHQGKFAEAVVRLRRATSVLPENSVWWRNGMWHLGASLDANGKGADALEAYYSSYRSGGPDATRRAVIEGLYRRVNGSLDGLDAKIGPSPIVAKNEAPGSIMSQPTQTNSTEASAAKTTEETKPVEITVSDTTSEQKVVTAETKPADVGPKTDAATDQRTNSSDVKAAEVAVTSDSTTETTVGTDKSVDTAVPPATVAPTPEPTPAQSPEPTPLPTPGPTPESTPSPSPVEVPPGPPPPAANDEPPAGQNITIPTTETASARTAREDTGQRPRRVSEKSCTLAVSESALTIQNNGGRAIIDITLEGGSSSGGITAATSDWSSLAVFPEPKSGTESSVTSFSLTSISKKTGLFTVTFKTPCGSKDVTVTVK
jgi:tetratricopeptide (TPR) repeat protein